MPGHCKRRQFKQTDAFTRGMVIGLKRAGWSIRQIAADTHLGASTVHRLWRIWLEQGNVAIYRNVGATRVTSASVDRRILRQAVAVPQATCTAILQHVQDTLDHSISTRTISRRLVANGLHSCRPLRRLPLTPPNRRQRLEWCRARSTWMTEWNRVVFSDESRFCLSTDSRRVRVWRRRGERSDPAAIGERPTLRQRGIMVWGAIAYDSRSPLLRIQGTMTAQRYVDDVLRPVTLPYLQGVPNALYQQDNARPHTARISQQALQDVQMLPWPPYSPDLSPIEHVWDIIGRRLHALPQPRSEDELWQMVEREWRAILQDAIRTLIDSLPRRVAACIAVRALQMLADVADGDARFALNCLEMSLKSSDSAVIRCEQVKNGLQRVHILYDRTGTLVSLFPIGGFHSDQHYDTISAFIKSMRGSDANAALYYLARMLAGGEDPRFIARRMMIFASEDVGLADSSALNLAVSTSYSCQNVGMPECRINLAHCAAYLARAPKSRESYEAFKMAEQCVKDNKGPLPPVPLHLRNASTRLMQDLGYGRGYQMYNHNGQQLSFLPESLQGVNFFVPP
ncbi:hypothetical protein LAZ67_8003963 [Cordylochernes scorpioides]|uniref:Transposase n=1 Tax=Cordylochernes scorpioides TaxID=51811 RepID=A0ABY6KSF6_9ARAC|nr:hypothetical protein LAZ67_8003963 [Cordylochernes scorpioides]